MTGVDWIVIGVIALVVGAALVYIIHAKKSGKKCIGCPDSCSCHAKEMGGKQAGGCNCGCGCQSNSAGSEQK